MTKFSLLSYLIRFFFPVTCYGCRLSSEDIVCPSCLASFQFISSKGRCLQCFSEVIKGSECACYLTPFRSCFWRSMFLFSPVLRRMLFSACRGKIVAQNFLIEAMIRRVNMEGFYPEVVVGVETHNWRGVSDLVRQATKQIAKNYGAEGKIFFLRRKNLHQISQKKKVLVLVCSEAFSEKEKKLLIKKLRKFSETNMFCLSIF
ncbi:hypothetical protein [Chlamydiifrater volucris]|uniref:hypothetical protein n=1 Tax=Chlamydiifrater volucris TaxID=2681470 RepID=UPI001BCD31CD|nr:hypothetical protein [Chlamydiifrater volucris]